MISVVLNVYKRPEMLEKQIEAIMNQSIPILPENIHVWFNNGDIKYELPANKEINTYQCNWNTKFWGRFTVPLLIRTEYIALFDDDIIPEKDWFYNCLETINNPETNGILGGSGVILEQKKYLPHTKIGWNAIHSNKTEQVDLVGHAWFFRQEWTKYLWYEKPFTWNNGEDIMFSYLAKKYGGINTFVPPHPELSKNIWSCNYDVGIRVGNDINASWKKQPHINERNNVCIYCIENGWETVKNIS